MSWIQNVLGGTAWPGRPADNPVTVPIATIAEIAREFGVTFQALRFYESRGLLAPLRIGRSRRYRLVDPERLALIFRGKKLGFTLDQVGRMIRGDADQADALDLSRQRCAEQINLLERKKRQIETALAELRLAYASDNEVRRCREAPGAQCGA